jgi:hypothetical protein
VSFDRLAGTFELSGKSWTVVLHGEKVVRRFLFED